MLAKRIIPCLDMTGGRVVKGVKFKNLRDAGDPPELGELYSRQGADELVFLDVTASSDKREILIDVVKRTADRVFIPFTVGGGIRSIEDIRRILCAGADKVAINTSAVEKPELIRMAAQKFGSQCIVCAIDAKRIYEEAPDKIVVQTPQGRCWWEVYTYGGRKPTGIDAIKWAMQVEKKGAGEILLTSMDCDGTKMGYDVILTRTVCEKVNIPVIASGGAGNLEHIYEVLTEGKADAALAASIFHYGIYSIEEVKKYLAKRNVLVRL
ncbi:MAG: imidazole glycerol phosphate synthase subunit HisF [Candidatus Freyarchaeota archaeon]|nr:imidazole glycerol phosphate synthase subunit HisF [Candidatus Jordarchaeia archaeon]MBS7269874.1 imidazole glycerol phosphate synthase subunit HisF [Candidatus Jordarchaeia archaeon]MBS7281595.1 imidazole glycerol phosphate synthase subunit HisF [Candidatus Jordarchaeia archaeon]